MTEPKKVPAPPRSRPDHNLIGHMEGARRRRATAAVSDWRWTVLAQGLGVGLVVFGVALILSAAWAVLVGGVLVLAAGSLAEATEVRVAAAARTKRRQDAVARRAA